MIGTTVVPYNLFLHASAAAESYSEVADSSLAIRYSRLDTFFSVLIGGAITASLLITSAVVFGTGELSDVNQIAVQLQPILGDNAELFFGLGLLAAGLTSAITAPIAAGLAVAGCFGWSAKITNPKVKFVAVVVVGIGLAFAMWFQSSPVQTIIFAQAANGILLPLIAILLVYLMNQQDVVGDAKNGWVSNSCSVIVIGLTLLISGRQLFSVWDQVWASIT